MSANLTHTGARTFRDVLGFTWRHWQRQPWLVAGIAAAMMAATISDVLMPVFAGRLVDAVGLIEADRDAARREALAALAAILALGVVMIVMRFLTFRGIIRLTLRIMAAIAQEAFWRVQRFSTEWHASTFGGSVVRRITRGMWAMDLLNDTLLVALLPSVVVLLATTVLLGLRWPAMGLVVAAGSAGFMGR
jgi:ATP-binding cassette subfamily B protein